jgi:hypothetical protein
MDQASGDNRGAGMFPIHTGQTLFTRPHPREKECSFPICDDLMAFLRIKRVQPPVTGTLFPDPG